MRYIQFTRPAAWLPPLSGGRLAAPRLEDEVGWLFGPALNAFAGQSSQFPVDLYEDKENTYVRAELPGVNRDAIGVEIVDGSLSIQATRKQRQGDAEASVPLSRLIAIPGEVQADKVAAAYENGVLTVTLPRREETKPRKINVSVS